jgi:OOP family OmpA-OmpF porin
MQQKLNFASGLVAILLGLSLLIPAAIRAEPPATLTLGGTYNIFDDDREVDDELTPFGALGFRFTERWGGEFWFSDGETDGDIGFDADITRWHLDALYYLSPRGRFHPYLAGGGGQLQRDWDVPNGSLDATDEEANFGAGAHWFLSDNFSLRADARYLFGFDDDTSDFTLSLAVAYRFAAPAPARRSEPAPEPEPEPEPQPVDSDGDGVMDPDDACPGTPPGVQVDERGCEVRFAPGESVELQVNFAFDSDEVDTRYLDDIEALADFMKRHPDVVADIEAHTDSMGPESYNIGLSRRRAAAVIEVLTERFGIPADRLVPRGYGESRPVAGNDTQQGRAANRRVMATLSSD